MSNKVLQIKNLGEELYYKLWVTKGARFRAHERIKIKGQLSNQTSVYLAAYLIIINLLGLMNLGDKFITPQMISFGSTALSILLLVFSQVEISYNYTTRSEKFHDCAKAISSLFLELREVMTSNGLEEQKNLQFKDISKKYVEIIDKHENHEHIDYQMFRTQHPKDYEISFKEKLYIYTKSYFKTFFMYHFLIVGPIVISVLYYIFVK